MISKNSFAALALLAIVAAIIAAAHAAPPTVTPSPGYDARLQESRKTMPATSTSDPSPSPVNPAGTHRHRAKPGHHAH